jgi:hypothetical protein
VALTTGTALFLPPDVLDLNFCSDPLSGINRSYGLLFRPYANELRKDQIAAHMSLKFKHFSSLFNEFLKRNCCNRVALFKACAFRIFAAKELNMQW